MSKTSVQNIARAALRFVSLAVSFRHLLLRLFFVLLFGVTHSESGCVALYANQAQKWTQNALLGQNRSNEFVFQHVIEFNFKKQSMTKRKSFSFKEITLHK